MVNTQHRLTFDCDTVTFQSDNADDPKIVIQNNTNDAQGARLQMKKDRGAAPSDNDNCHAKSDAHLADFWYDHYI